MLNARQVAFKILKEISLKESYTDLALNRGLEKSNLVSTQDRALVTELVYGIVRRQRTLDTLIDQFGHKKAQQQPPDIRLILQLGFYQLRYMEKIPVSAAVNTSVDLAKQAKYGQLTGVVNGILRKYIRLTQEGDPLKLPSETVSRLGILYSFPDWIIELFLKQFGVEETEKLCAWFNQTPSMDIRINPLKTTLEEVKKALEEVGIKTDTFPDLPQALRLVGSHGAINQLPGYNQGWWTIQDASAQQVTHLLDPQPNETIVDACAAPGGKTSHIAELMRDQGKIWAIDRTPSRLRRLQENTKRLGLTSIEIKEGDSRSLSEFNNTVDRLLLDVPCSGLGTLHRHPDLRWKQTHQKIEDLIQLQKDLLELTQSWVKPKGILVYSTCTLNQGENESVIEEFLNKHQEWKIQNVSGQFSKIIPHQVQRDGFFMVKLCRE